MASRPGQYRRRRHGQAGRPDASTRRRSRPLRRVPAPANDNRFRMSRTGRFALLALVAGIVLAIALYVTF